MSRRYQLVYVSDLYDENAEEILTYLHMLSEKERKVSHPALTASLQEIVNFLDQELENANYHDMVGIYQILDNQMSSCGIDESVRRRLMLNIAEGGGLEGMA